jgi:DNA-binding MarR family transcriptional regulator
MSKTRPDGEREGDEAEILNSFRRILQALRLAAVQTHNETGVSAAQLYVLQQLDAYGSMSINQLAQATMTDRSSVADVVDRLAHRKLVRRGLSPEDKRRASVQLTDKGRALLAKAPQPPTAQLLAGLTRLSSGELHALATGLNRLVEELGIQDTPTTLLFESARRNRSRR